MQFHWWMDLSRLKLLCVLLVLPRWSNRHTCVVLLHVSSVINVGAILFSPISTLIVEISLPILFLRSLARTKAIICVHLVVGSGHGSDHEFALNNNLFVIEDCAQAHGSYKGRSVVLIGHIGSWSFCQDKIMSMGGEAYAATTIIPFGNYGPIGSSGKDHSAVYDRSYPPGSLVASRFRLQFVDKCT